jgi:hypothetical protein
MPSLECFLVAGSASIDRSTNRVSLFPVIEDVPFERLPGFVPQRVAVRSGNTGPD